MNWLFEKIELTIQPPETKILLAGTSNDWNYGDISVDDLIINGGHCQENRELENEFGTRFIRYSNFGQQPKINITKTHENIIEGYFFFKYAQKFLVYSVN